MAKQGRTFVLPAGRSFVSPEFSGSPVSRVQGKRMQGRNRTITSRRRRRRSVGRRR